MARGLFSFLIMWAVMVAAFQVARNLNWLQAWSIARMVLVGGVTAAIAFTFLVGIVIVF